MRGLLLIAVLSAACSGAIVPVPPAGAPEPTVREGAPLDVGASPERVAVPAMATARALGRLGDAVVVASDEGLSRLEGSSFVPLAVGAPGEAMSTGPVRFLAARGSGVLALAQAGLFHDSEGRLLRAPLSDSVSTAGLTAAQPFGAGAQEELWLLGAGRLTHVANGEATAVSLEENGAALPLDAVAPAGAGAAVLVSGSRLFRFTAATLALEALASQVPAVTAVASASDGTVSLATAQGLVTVPPTGAVTRDTLAAKGAAALSVDDVEVLGGELFAVAGGKVLQRTATGFTTRAPATQVRAHGLTRDAAGDLFLLEGSAVTRLKTAHRTSFEADVKPFMVAHCQGCHAQSPNPVRAFDTLAVASLYAADIVLRLQGLQSRPVMPPASAEVLAAADYAVVLAWVREGMEP
jgi:hypothetical protein